MLWTSNISETNSFSKFSPPSTLQVKKHILQLSQQSNIEKKSWFISVYHRRGADFCSPRAPLSVGGPFSPSPPGSVSLVPITRCGSQFLPLVLMTRARAGSTNQPTNRPTVGRSIVHTRIYTPRCTRDAKFNVAAAARAPKRHPNRGTRAN